MSEFSNRCTSQSHVAIAEKAEHLAHYIYVNYLGRNQVDLNKAEEAGMVAKRNLVDGQVYLGHCRNSSKATWSAEKVCFVYDRTKFGSTFTEVIKHPEDDIGFDIFVPVAVFVEDPSQ